MTKTTSHALKSIHENYGLMLENGYEVLSVPDYDLGWQVVLKKRGVYGKLFNHVGKKEYVFERAFSRPRGSHTLEASSTQRQERKFRVGKAAIKKSLNSLWTGLRPILKVGISATKMDCVPLKKYITPLSIMEKSSYHVWF
jgi:hypothetical protein